LPTKDHVTGTYKTDVTTWYGSDIAYGRVVFHIASAEDETDLPSEELRKPSLSTQFLGRLRTVPRRTVKAIDGVLAPAARRPWSK
jgi:hypothetical protein